LSCAPDVEAVGIGFLYPEWVLVLWAARRLGRRQMDRRARRGSSPRRRARQPCARAPALDQDGRFLALDVDTVANLALSVDQAGSTNSPASAMGEVYAIPAVFMAVRGTFTNTVPIDAYRGRQAKRLPDRAARRSRRTPAGDRPGRVGAT
jgi:carbon-monoxide dehydrogenase large subunit